VLHMTDTVDWITGYPPIAAPSCGFRGEKCIKWPIENLRWKFWVKKHIFVKTIEQQLRAKLLLIEKENRPAYEQNRDIGRSLRRAGGVFPNNVFPVKSYSTTNKL
ncbi:hypothetical protein NQ315_002851, partial [Exocentrus adspersus]